MSHRILPKLLSLLCMCVVAGGAWAQENLAQEYTFIPKAGMGYALVTALRAHTEWRAQNGDPWSWSTYEIATGEEMGSILVRSGDHTWADFDAYEAGFGPQGDTHFAATVSPLLESTSSSISVVDTTKLRWPADASEYTLFQIVEYHLKPDRTEQFNVAMNKIHSAIAQQNYPVYYAFVSPVVGETGPTTTIVFPFRNWSEFEEPDQPIAAMLAEVYGAEEAAGIFAELANGFTAIESRVLRLRPDLSVTGNPGM